jgi:hypothetical protein
VFQIGYPRSVVAMWVSIAFAALLGALLTLRYGDRFMGRFIAWWGTWWPW